MDVNTARERVRIPWLQAAQPDNPRDDWIAARRVRPENLPSKAPAVKNRPDRSMISDLLCDLQETERRRHAAPAIAAAKLRGGNRIRRNLRSVFDEHQSLIVNADDDTAWSFRCGAETCSRKKKEG